jgi:uncharacterized phiE125 gp8 family phage protein
MALIRITAPAVEPLTLAEAKLHCRVDGSDEDALITALIVAAREQAEHETGRALVTQTWELVHDAFPEAFVLRKAPIQSVTSLKYLDSTTSVEQTLDPADYILDKDSEPGYVVPAYGKAWPNTWQVPNAVRVRYVCGYGLAAAVPVAIKQWMLLAIGTMYAQRETIISGQAASLPDRFWSSLLDPYRLYEAT